MPNSWDGRERRNSHDTDHDTLIELMQILKNHVENFDAHIVSDAHNFKELGDRIWTHAKFIYVGLGIAIALNFLATLLHK